MEFINIGPVYNIRAWGWVGGAQGWGGWWQKLKQRRKKTQIVEFRVAMYDIYMHPKRANILLQGLDRHELTVGAISGPHSKIGALLWCHCICHGFTCSAKHSGKADQSTLASGGSEHAWLFSVAISGAIK